MNPEPTHVRIAALEATELISLVGHHEEIEASTPLEIVYKSFRDHPHEFIGLVEAGRLTGVTSRGKIAFALGSRYGFSLFARDPVAAYGLERSLCLPGDMRLRAVLDRALSRGDGEFFQDVAVIDGKGRYCGMVSVPALVRLQNELSIQQTRLAEEQRASLRGKAALRASEERLRLALAAGRMNAWQVDLRTGQLTWSAVTGSNGWTAGILPDSLTAFRESVVPEDRDATFAALESCQRENRPFSVQYRVRHPGDGTLRWIESHGTAHGGPDAPTVSITGLSIDITARKQAEEALRTAKEEAERANNAKSDFLSRMSHELRTPLNAILGFGQLIELDAASPDQRESVGHILRAGRHLLGLIDEVLDIARIETGRLQLDLESLGVHRFAQETLGLVSLLAERHGIRLENGVGPDGCRVVADRRRFRQVLVNLLTNAIKYNRAGGEVAIRCHATGSGCDQREAWTRVEVRDTGIGIAPEVLGRLFAPFDRLGQEHLGTIEGTGIGLALSKALTEAMGGRVGVESVPGVGSTFWVELPAGAQPPVESGVFRHPGQTAPGDAPTPAAPAATLVYVEDNESNLRLVEFFLRRERGDLALLSASDGPRGLELIRSRRPDLVLLDLQLPGLGGEAILRELAADPATRDLPVIVLSADATPSSRQRLLAAGACEYLCKPLEMHAFLAVLNRVLPAAVAV